MKMKLICNALAVLALASSAIAQEFKNIDVILDDAELSVATRALTMQTGIQFVIKGDPTTFKRVTLDLRNMPANKAIEYIASAAGGYAEVDQNNVWNIYFGAKPVETSNSNTTVGTIQRPKVRETVKLNFRNGRDLLSVLFYGNQNIIESFDAQELAEAVRQQTGYTLQLMNPNAPVQLNNPSLGESANGMQSGAVTLNDRNQAANFTTANNNVRLPGEGVEQIGGGGGGRGGNNGGGGGNQGGGGGNQPGGGAGGGSLDTGLTGGTGLVPDGIERVIYDPSTNSFFVVGTQDAINELRGIIEQLDVAPRQLMVKVEYVQVSRSLDKSLGIDWLYARGSTFAGVRPGSFAQSSDPIFINYATGNLTTRLRTNLTNSNSRVVNAPIVRTMENQPAILTNNITTYFFSATQQNGAGGIITTYTPVPVNATTVLAVKPRINGDGTITMILTPALTEFGDTRRSPDGVQEIPTVLSQTLSVAVRLKDGETIAMGGFTRKNDRYVESRIPILSDLPLIGRLFRRRSDNETTQDLIIFVTAKIVADDESGLGGP